MMKCGLLLLVCFTAAVLAKEDFTGHQVWRIQPHEPLQLRGLVKLMERGDFDFWQEDFSLEHPADVRVPPESRERFQMWLRNRGLTYTTMIEDIQSLLDKEAAYQMTHPPPENMAELDTSRYYTLSEIEEYMDSVASENDNVEVFVTGNSYEERPTRGIKISQPGEGRRAVWVDCGIHAREWISPAICQYIIDQLVNGDDSETESVRNSFDWFIYPVVNVDGYEYTFTDDRMWRKTRRPNEGSTCVGTDGNRNFRVGWSGTGSSDNPCSQTYRGPEAFSEVETRNQDEYIRSQGAIFDLGITIHSYGQFMVYPWGYTRDFDPENIDELDRVCQAAVDAIIDVNGISFNGRRSNGDMAGNTIDTLMEDGQMAFAYLYEVRDTGANGFLLPPEQILPTDEEIWAGVRQSALEIIALRN